MSDLLCNGLVIINSWLRIIHIFSAIEGHFQIPLIVFLKKLCCHQEQLWATVSFSCHYYYIHCFPLVFFPCWMERWKLPMLSINFLTLQIKLPENCSLKNEFITSATAISLHPDNLIFTLSHKYLLVLDRSTLLCPIMALGWSCRNGQVQNKQAFFLKSDPYYRIGVCCLEDTVWLCGASPAFVRI